MLRASLLSYLMPATPGADLVAMVVEEGGVIWWFVSQREIMGLIEAEGVRFVSVVLLTGALD